MKLFYVEQNSKNFHQSEIFTVVSKLDKSFFQKCLCYICVKVHLFYIDVLYSHKRIPMAAYKVFYDFNFKPGLQILPEAHFDFGYFRSYGHYTRINICG